MPAGGAGGNVGYPVVSSAGWNCMPNGLPAVDSATFGSSQPGGADVGSGMQSGASGLGVNAGMPAAGGGVAGSSAGRNGAMGNSGGVNLADVNIGSIAGADVTGGRVGIPDCRNPVAGGVPVLPDVSVQLVCQ